ncbi:MFS transporter [Streptomyces sp. NBC_01443]|uniref:MFS transporter n=1 Tax=Streptomyces sp. NBC_01443 TaxID=2903868 RepID=UPI0022569C72|nr:MFS transporter [Streptomyces sp. NBC_01443]MCX4625699.1 MFS transporter [Streptomyces sp. NBC_01443]
MSPLELRPAAARRTTTSRRALLAGSAGNLVEWYEFGVYGCLATVIAANFFRHEGSSGAEALVATYASFALAFFFRPVGAVLFGRLGDRLGRRPTLIVVVGLMTLATAMIGLLPTRAAIGGAAPWLLTLLRVLQGLSAGGEFGGAVSLMTEYAPVGRRGLYGAWQSFTVALGLLTGAGTAAALATALPAEALYAWGWRIPFLLALPLGAVALWLRTALEEPPGAPPGDGRDGPVGARELARAVVLGIGRIMGWSAAGYTFLVVLPSYLQATLGASLREALLATALANAGFAASILPAGALSDRIGRRPVMLSGALGVVVLALPLVHLLQSPGASPWARAGAVLLAGALVGLLAGPGPAMLAEMFPRRVRCTGLGLAYSLANAVFSGCAGLVITALIARTGDPAVPAYYAAGACALSCPALLALRGRAHREPLR